MKFLIILVGVLLCVGFLVARQKLQANVNQAVEQHEAIVGMTEAQATQALGEPLLVKRTEMLFGNEAVMTFSDGNMVTFKGGRATKIDTVKVSAAVVELAKSPGAPVKLKEAMARPTPEPQHGTWMWKNYKNPLDPPSQNRR